LQAVDQSRHDDTLEPKELQKVEPQQEEAKTKEEADIKPANAAAEENKDDALAAGKLASQPKESKDDDTLEPSESQQVELQQEETKKGETGFKPADAVKQKPEASENDKHIDAFKAKLSPRGA